MCDSVYKDYIIPYFDKVQDIELYGSSVVDDLDAKWTNSSKQNDFMNFWYIEHYDASFGDDIDAKMNYFKRIKWLFNVYWL